MTPVLTPDRPRPLVTFALFSYNQEQFIEHALRGALAQTYEPLEIIVSDDCSEDRTFEIIQEIAGAYSGPHNIRLNRNANNMGISRNVQYVHGIARGEYIIHAAGDDISYPERTTKVVEAFQAESPVPSLVMSNAHVIDEDGTILGLFSAPDQPVREIDSSPTDFTSIGGAGTYAIHRSLVATFPPPAREIYGEDRILLIRAKLMAGTAYIPDILVQYRVSRYGVWSSGFIGTLRTEELLQRQLNRAQDYIYILKQAIDDVRRVGHVRAELIINEMEAISRVKRNWVAVLSGSFATSSRGLVAELARGTATAELAKLYLMRWFPFLRRAKLRVSALFGQTREASQHPAIQVPRKN